MGLTPKQIDQVFILHAMGQFPHKQIAARYGGHRSAITHLLGRGDLFLPTRSATEQYAGWLRPPAAGAIDEAAKCARILINHASVSYTISQILGDQQIFKLVYAEAMRRAHPDASHGRDVADFQNVVNARDRIKILKGMS
jgi:hypothetical protein